MSRRKIAIACQGGGSHTAFTAGAVCRLLSPEITNDIEIVGLSGTSGGAVCASLVWSGLMSGESNPEGEAVRRLRGFWEELEARWPLDVWINACAVGIARMPVTAEISPYAYWPVAEWRMRELLERHLQLEKLPSYPHFPSLPKLLIGATDIRRGEGKPFTGENLRYDHIIASAAIPPVFRAVQVDGFPYWDGLFNRNPPVREFTDIEKPHRPNEIWLIRINPIERADEPITMPDIIDRRNELAGNLAVDQELYHIHKVNELIADGRLAGYQHITLRQIKLEMPNLDYVSKLDRSPSLLRELFEAGGAEAMEFFRPGSEIKGAYLTDRTKEKASDPGSDSASEVVDAGVVRRRAGRP